MHDTRFERHHNELFVLGVYAIHGVQHALIKCMFRVLAERTCTTNRAISATTD